MNLLIVPATQTEINENTADNLKMIGLNELHFVFLKWKNCELLLYAKSRSRGNSWITTEKMSSWRVDNLNLFMRNEY